MNSGRDFLPMGRRDPMPMPPALGNMRGLNQNSMRGMSGNNGGGYDSVFSRRSPPRSGNGVSRFR